MNIYKIAFVACSIFQVVHGADLEKAISLRNDSTKSSVLSETSLLDGRASRPNSSVYRCAKKTVACIECTRCTPGCTMCCTCALISCVTTPTFLASFCIMSISASGTCAVKAALANTATKVCLGTCLPGTCASVCCWPGGEEGQGSLALIIDRGLVKWSEDSDRGETEEAEPLLNAASISLPFQREEQ